MAVTVPPGTLLVLRALGLGDLLTAVPALRALRRAFPQHRIVLAAPAALDGLARRSGAVDALLPAAGLAPLGLPAGAVDVAVNLHGRGPQSHHVLVATRPRRLLAFAHAAVPESRRGPVWREGEHEVVRWCRLLASSGIAADPGELDLSALPLPALARHVASHDVTIVHPGAKDAARRWPVERWAAVARDEQLHGRTVLVTGDVAERPLAARVAAAARLPDDANVAGRTDLEELAGLVAHAGRVVCGDTGIAHLATALRTPSVVLFGPTSPATWGPPPDRPWHRTLWHGRRGDPHAAETDPGLLAIGAREVIEALRTLPQGRPRAGAVAAAAGSAA